ncbi:MAG: filamentous hemagglutinin N-terminal domain-containing protein, partial [Verrucomicrobiales bacterium]
TSGANNLGQNPNQPSQVLPDVPDGLTTGGLKVDARVPTTPSLWVGADGPTQTTNTGSGRVEVTVKQTAQQAILNWDTFNVGKNTDLKFDQSAGGSNVGQWTAFNKVNDASANPTQILGTITAPGQVYIINRNGILFGGSSKVNTHTLVASSLPINDNLIERGLLNNPDQQFLFSAMALTAGANGTPAFDPGVSPSTKIGDVTVQAGAQLTAPTTAEKVGGRIALIGPNVNNSGTISTPDGQTILAAGLQVGMVAHTSSDPSLRGLDVYVGAVVDPLSSVAAYAGTTTNSGLIDSARANIMLVGKDIRQLGVVSSSTSVSLNGRIDFLANYNAVGNIAFDASNSSFGPSFLNQSTGSILLGESSVTRVVPELDSTEKTVGIKLALSSQINLTGANAHLDDGAIILSQSGDVSISVGNWLTTPATSSSSPPLYLFVRSTGRIDLDVGSVIDVGGSQNVASSVASNIVEVQLRGAELANSPLIRDGALRGATIFVDITETGTYNGKTWIGTPLADVSGYANLVQRTVGELTASGGTVKLNAGEAVVVRDGATINVSGGSINFEGGAVKTTRVTSGGQIIDISKATPDRVYDGIYGASNTITSDKWGTSSTYVNPIALNGSRYQEGFSQGGNGGSLSITSGAMALDGSLKGGTIVGQRQRFTAPTASSLSLNFSSERLIGGLPVSFSPNSPRISFSSTSNLSPIGDYVSGSNTLANDRLTHVNLSPVLFGTEGFGALAIVNPDGDVMVDSGVALNFGSRGSLDVSAANVTVNGSIIAAGGSITLKAYNLSPTYVAELNLGGATDIPAPAANRGLFTLGAGGLIDASGKVADDRPLSLQPVSTSVQTTGGTVSISSYSANFSTGSLIDVSGGAYVSGTGKVTYGNAGALSILSGSDLNLSAVVGGSLKLNGELRGYSGATGGSITLRAGSIKVGGTSPTSATTLWLQPGFFDQGGFSKFSLIGFGELESGTGNTVAGITIAEGTAISPTVASYVATGTTTGGPITLAPVVKPLGLRGPVSLSFSSPGVLNDFTRIFTVRGQVFTAASSVVDAGPNGSISLSGNTVELHGSLRSSGGSIRVSGSNRYPTLLADPPAAATTVMIGSDAVIDASGSLFKVPDPYGRNRGAVLDGGMIRISGNVVAESGSILNVSGASGTLDLLAGESGKALETLQDGTSGTLTTPYAISGSPTLIESNGGTIALVGGEMMWSDATLKANSGGNTATGGTLQVSSGAFYPLGVVNSPLDATLVVKASGPVLPSSYVAAIGADMPVDSSGIAGGGRLAVDRFTAGGFSNLDLSGTVRFSGPVSIEASGRITAGTSPVLLADSTVSLKASYVSIGTAFQAPRTADEEANFNLVTLNGAQFFMPPTHGNSTLNVSAQLIDVGYLALRGFASANLTAVGGDIRGSGALEVAGDITLRAGQVYSPTASSFTVAAFDYLDGAISKKGSVSIEASGTRSLPLSAGSSLNIYGSIIHQNGVLRAPFGSIQLGWDGSGTAPHDKQLSNLDYAKTTELVLGSQSVTSVSAIDPITGKGITIPYGLSTNGTTW